MNFDIKKVKITVTVPIQNIEDIRNSVCDEGAGIIGNYIHCTVITECIGTFKPSSNANPYIGEKNKLEYVKEQKLEFICDITKVKKVINKLKEIHPYEEPGIDIIPLIDEKDL